MLTLRAACRFQPVSVFRPAKVAAAPVPGNDQCHRVARNHLGWLLGFQIPDLEFGSTMAGSNAILSADFAEIEEFPFRLGQIVQEAAGFEPQFLMHGNGWKIVRLG